MAYTFKNEKSGETTCLHCGDRWTITTSGTINIIPKYATCFNCSMCNHKLGKENLYTKEQIELLLKEKNDKA